MRCKKCRKEINHPRRGMCLNCYRKVTGLSKSKPAKLKKSKSKHKLKSKPRFRPELKLESKLKPDLKPEPAPEKPSLSITWWKEYLASDILKRQDLLASLSLVKELAKKGFPDLSNIQKYQVLSKEELAIEQEKFNSYMLVTMLYSYIEDLIEVKDLKYYSLTSEQRL